MRVSSWESNFYPILFQSLQRTISAAILSRDVEDQHKDRKRLERLWGALPPWNLQDQMGAKDHQCRDRDQDLTQQQICRSDEEALDMAWPCASDEKALSWQPPGKRSRGRPLGGLAWDGGRGDAHRRQDLERAIPRQDRLEKICGRLMHLLAQRGLRESGSPLTCPLRSMV